MCLKKDLELEISLYILLINSIYKGQVNVDLVGGAVGCVVQRAFGFRRLCTREGLDCARLCERGLYERAADSVADSVASN